MASLIVPEIFKGIVSAKFKEKVKVLNLAENIGEIEGFRQVGETIHFPKFKALDTTKMKEMKKGDVLETSELEQEDSTATIKHVGFATRVYDIDDVTAFGNHIDEAGKQHATIFARKLDTDLVAEALKSPFKIGLAESNAITNSELAKAMELFGDEIDVDEFGGIVINSRLVSSFYSMQEFVDVAKTYTTNGNGIVRNGCIGYWRGIPIFVANHGTYDNVKNESIGMIIKKGSLGYKMKKEIDTEVERIAKAQANDVVTNSMYATKLLSDSGIVILRKTII